MQYSKFDMFFDKEAMSSGCTEAAILDFGYNRNMEDNLYLAVHSPGSAAIAATLATADSTASGATWTTLRQWGSSTPDANGYVVMEKLPKGVKNYLKLTASAGTDATVTAGLVLERDLDFDLSDRDPAAVFDGIVPPQTI